MTLTFHPLANVFPLIEGTEFDELVSDIRAHGVREPIWIYEGQIIDGRNRYRASELAGVDCPMRAYTGDDPVSFVISLNLKRRHLNESQRAMVAAKLATLGHGGDRSKSPIGDLSQARAAELLNVGKRSVERATIVRDHGAADLQAAVERGEVSVSAAANIASKPKDKQREIVARGEVVEAARAIRAERHVAATVAAAVSSQRPPASKATAADRDDIGPTSAREVARLEARIKELQNGRFRLETQNDGLAQEVEELKAAAAEQGLRLCGPDRPFAERLESLFNALWSVCKDSNWPELSVARQRRLRKAKEQLWAARVELVKLAERAEPKQHGVTEANAAADDGIPPFLQRTLEGAP